MRVVLDTSVLHGDLILERPAARLLLAASANGELGLVVPEVVVLESVSLFRERLDALQRALVNARRDYAAIGLPVDVEPPDTETSQREFEARLRQRLADAAAQVPLPPDATHLDVTMRAIAKRKPFDSKGRGYRDTLIWLQALEEAAADETVLVTANTKDFASEDGSALANELADELEAAGLARDRIRISTSLPGVVRDHVEPSVEAVTRMRALLGDERFREQVYDAVNGSLLYREVDAPHDDELRELDVTDIQIDGVHEISELEIDDAYVDGERLAFNIGGTALAEADFYPHKSQILGSDVPGVSVIDWDWNEWVVRATKMLELGFEGFGSYDPEAGEIELVDVWLVY